jgi:hypothetical protein
MVLNDWINSELEKCGRKQLWPNLRYYPSTEHEHLAFDYSVSSKLEI